MPIRMMKIPNSDNIKCWRGSWEQQELFLVACDSFWQHLTKPNLLLTCNLVIALPDICANKNMSIEKFAHECL